MSGFIDPSIFPDAVHPLVAQLGEYHQKRMWHQLVEALTVLVKSPEASVDKNLIQVSPSYIHAHQMGPGLLPDPSTHQPFTLPHSHPLAPRCVAVL